MTTPDLPATYTPSNVHPYLWIGSAPPVDHELTGFGAVVLCAQEYQPPAMSFLGHIWRVRLEDHEEPIPHDSSQARGIVRAGRTIAKMANGGEHVLVTCFAGLNRSALVLGTALVEMGYQPENVISAIRLNHSMSALNNRAFVRFLLEHGRALPQRV